MLRFQHVLIRGRWVQDTAFVVECINSGGGFYDTFLKLVFRTGNFCSGLSNSQKVTSMGVQAVPWGGSSWHHVRMFFLSRILCFECVCRFICARVWDLRKRVEEQLYQCFASPFSSKHTHKLKRSILNIDVEAVTLLEQSGSAVFMSDNYNLLLNKHSQPQSEISPITSPESFLQNHRRRYTTGK